MTPRYFFWPFITVFAGTVAALLWLRAVTLPTAVLEDEQRRWALAALPSDEIAALKIRHAEEAPRYDIGLFGNSRILMLGADELNPGKRRVFNFAIGGQSVRQGLRLLEELHARHKMPAIAVISMDHVELGMPGGSAVFPGLPTRLFDAADDVQVAGRQLGNGAALLQFNNAVHTEGKEIALTFNHTFVRAKLAALAGMTGPALNFRADGSQKEIVPATPDIQPLRPRADLYPHLENDFARFAAMRDAGARVLIYESPIAPSLGGTEDGDLSVNARNVRRRYKEACAKFRLECYGPPVLTARPWFDPSHAPADQLAAWLNSKIDKTN
jgi:hypothetical protein